MSTNTDRLGPLEWTERNLTMHFHSRPLAADRTEKLPLAEERSIMRVMTDGNIPRVMYFFWNLLFARGV